MYSRASASRLAFASMVLLRVLKSEWRDLLLFGSGSYREDDSWVSGA